MAMVVPVVDVLPGPARVHARRGLQRGREVTDVEAAAAEGPPSGARSVATATSDWPTIPAVAWRRGIGVPCPDVGHPRVHTPMLDDGEWAGVPMGGLGTGSIGRTFRGDVARWHLSVGQHRFEPVAADGFSLFVGRADGTSRATALRASGHRPATCRPGASTCPSAAAPTTPCSRGPGRPSSRRRSACGSTSEQLSPVIAGDLRSSALPVGVFEVWCENPGPEPLTVGLMFTFADPPGGPDDGPAPARPHATAHDPVSDARGVRFGDAAADAPTALRGSLAIAAAGDGWAVTTRATLRCAPRHGAVGRLRRRRPAGHGPGSDR